MKTSTQYILEHLLEHYPELSYLKDRILVAFEILISCYNNGGKILICGNGGSSADCDHIVGELMKGFLKKRELPIESPLWNCCPEIARSLQRGIPAISLSAQTALFTAFANDNEPDYVFAQQVQGYFRNGDVVIGISTSGNSTNVVAAIKVAHALGGATIALTGASGGILKQEATITLDVPETETYRVQELHLPMYHCLCAMLEEELF